MKMTIASILFFTVSLLSAFTQQVTVQSPNEKIIVALFCEQNAGKSGWYLKASYNDKDLETTYAVVAKSGSVDVKLLRRGGFTAYLTPLP